MRQNNIKNCQITLGRVLGCCNITYHSNFGKAVTRWALNSTFKNRVDDVTTREVHVVCSSCFQDSSVPPF